MGEDSQGKIHKVEYPLLPLGNWQAPRLDKPVSEREIDELWAQRAFLKRIADRGWKKLSKAEKDGILKKCRDKLNRYNLPEFDIWDKSTLSEDLKDLNKVWDKINEVLMRATFPLVASGRVPLEVRIHLWLRKHWNIKFIWFRQATLWHKAANWGFEKWRSDVYSKYWSQRWDALLECEDTNDDAEVGDTESFGEEFDYLQKEEDDWYGDFYKGRKLFSHFLQMYGYQYVKAAQVFEDYGCHFMNE